MIDDKELDPKQYERLNAASRLMKEILDGFNANANLDARVLMVKRVNQFCPKAIIDGFIDDVERITKQINLIYAACCLYQAGYETEKILKAIFILGGGYESLMIYSTNHLDDNQMWFPICLN